MPTHGSGPVELATISRPQPGTSATSVRSTPQSGTGDPQSIIARPQPHTTVSAVPSLQQSDVAGSQSTTARPTSSVAASAPAAPDPCPSIVANVTPPPQECLPTWLRDWLRQTWIGNLTAVIGTFLGIIGVVWTLYTGIVGLRPQVWSARNDALQTCLSMRTEDIFSAYCNETIHAAYTGPPLRKRAIFSFTDILGLKVDESTASIMTLRVVVTVAVGCFTIVCFNSRIRLFRPVVSLVRLSYQFSGDGWITIEQQLGYFYQHTTRKRTTKIRFTEILPGEGCGDEQGHTQDQHQRSPDREDGVPVIVSYESDDETGDSDSCSPPADGQWKHDNSTEKRAKKLKSAIKPAGLGAGLGLRVRFAEKPQYIQNETDSPPDAWMQSSFKQSSLMYGYDDVTGSVDPFSFLLSRLRLDQPLNRKTREDRYHACRDPVLIPGNSIESWYDDELPTPRLITTNLRALSHHELVHLGSKIPEMLEAWRSFSEERFPMGFSGPILVRLMAKEQGNGHYESQLSFYALMMYVTTELNYRLDKQLILMYKAAQGLHKQETEQKVLRRFCDRLCYAQAWWNNRKQSADHWAPPEIQFQHPKLESVLHLLKNASVVENPDGGFIDQHPLNVYVLSRYNVEDILTFLKSGDQPRPSSLSKMLSHEGTFWLDRSAISTICANAHSMAHDLTVALFSGPSNPLRCRFIDAYAFEKEDLRRPGALQNPPGLSATRTTAREQLSHINGTVERTRGVNGSREEMWTPSTRDHLLSSPRFGRYGVHPVMPLVSMRDLVVEDDLVGYRSLDDEEDEWSAPTL